MKSHFHTHKPVKDFRAKEKYGKKKKKQTDKIALKH